MKEFVNLVTQDNISLGIMEKIEAHKKGLLHQAVSVFVFNKKKELLLQKRAEKKYHCGRLWSNTVCTHPRPNESFLEAAKRRLPEEMGFSCELEEVFRTTYQADLENGLQEHEYDVIFFGEYEGQVRPNSDEVSDYAWMSLEKIEKELHDSPEKYTPWFRILFPIYYHEEKNITIPVPKHPGDVPKGTLRAILHESEINVEDFIDL